jgi:hypothetical protein
VDDFLAIRALVGRHDDAYDYVASGTTASPADADTVRAWHAVGATWWLESLHSFGPSADPMRDRLRAGPPQL